MKTSFKSFCVAAITAIAILSPSVSLAAMPTGDELGQHLDSDITKVNELGTYLDQTEDELEGIVARLDSYSGTFQESVSFYQTCKEHDSSDMSTVCSKAFDGMQKVLTNVTAMKTAINAGDAEGADAAITGINGGIDDLNSATTTYNENFAGMDYGPIYIGLTILFAIVSLVFYTKTRVTVDGDASKTKHATMLGLFKSSLWPLGGALITTIWYYLTPVGSTYYVFYGPVVIGGIYFLRDIFTYMTKNRSTINQEWADEKKKTGR